MNGLGTKIRQWAFAFAAMLGLSLFFPGPASAGIDSCSVETSGMVFSSYDTQTRAAVDGTGTITITCTGDGSSNNLSLNITGGNNGACSPRQMRNGANNLSYTIFQNAGRTLNFCDGGSKLDLAIDFGAGSTQTRTYTMFGRIASGQNPPFGNYSDSVAISLKRGGGTLASTSAAITGTVSPICSVTAGTLGFGTYTSTAAALAAASVTVNCSSGGAYQVSLGAGSWASGGSRRMAGPASSFLTYQLFRDSARTIAWGDGAAHGARVSGTGSGSNQVLNVFGRIPAGQSAVPGTYTDSVMVTVEY